MFSPQSSHSFILGHCVCSCLSVECPPPSGPPAVHPKSHFTHLPMGKAFYRSLGELGRFGLLVFPKKTNLKKIIYHSVVVSSTSSQHTLKSLQRQKIPLDYHQFQFSSVAQSSLNLCNPMNRNTPGLPVHHQLLESTQTHVHRVSDAIQPSHPLSSPSPPALNLSQHHGLFK